MADIFVSYAREDEARIRSLVQMLEAQHWSVFWDRRIPPGKSWREHIGRALAEARCVIVAWSAHSIASSFVAEEADDARNRGLLVPVMIDPVLPPLGFRSVQAAELPDLGRADPPAGAEVLLGAVRSVLSAAPAAAPVTAAAVSAPAAAVPPRRHLPTALWLAGIGVLLAITWLVFGNRQPTELTPAVRVPRVEAPPIATTGRATATPALRVLEVLRPESGGTLVRVQLVLSGRAAVTVTGSEAFALRRPGGSDEAPQDSRPIFDTVQPGTPAVFELRFRSADGVALRLQLPDTEPVDVRLAPPR